MLVGTVAAALYPKLEVADGAAYRGRCGDAGLRQAAAALLAARPPHHHHAQLLRRIAHAAERRRLVEARAARRSRGACSRLILSTAAASGPRARVDARISWRNSASFSPCSCISSRPGRRSTWSISTGCARVTTRCARYSTRTACTGAGTGAACSAYGVGFAAMIPFFSVPGLYVGPVARALGGADIAMLVGCRCPPSCTFGPAARSISRRTGAAPTRRTRTRSGRSRL